MSLIAHTFLPRSMFDMDAWFTPYHLGPSTLDIFDPFDDLDRLMGRNLMWLDKPAFLDFSFNKAPRVPQKYRVSLDCRGYNAKSLKTELKDGKLIISGSEGKNNGSEDGTDYSHKEFRKSFKLPENVESEKMVSFLTSSGRLIVEIPLKQPPQQKPEINGDDLFPKIVTDDSTGQKQVTVRLSLPRSLVSDPSKISVTCKDRDLIVKAEETISSNNNKAMANGEGNDENDAHATRTFYYQRTTLPENTDFNALKCIYEPHESGSGDGHLRITAPLRNSLESSIKSIPIEFKSAAPTPTPTPTA
jgi:HSP20 family molecular chaperone IbpA